jgi:hypothetical protein
VPRIRSPVPVVDEARYASQVSVARRALCGSFSLAFCACSAAATKPPPVADSTPPPTTSAPDGSLPASSDGGGAEARAPGTWCAGRTEDFCDDFDTPALSSTWWTMDLSNGTGGAGLPPGSLGTTTFTSAPNAFVAKTPAITVVTPERFQIERGGGPDASHVDADFAFDVRVAAYGGGPRAEIARIEGVNPITFASYAVALLVTASGASVELTQGSQGSSTQALTTAPAVGVWSRVVIHLALERTVNGPPTSLSVQVDAAPAETFSIARGMGARPFYRLGLVVTGPAAPCEVAYDDVTIVAR